MLIFGHIIHMETKRTLMNYQQHKASNVHLYSKNKNQQTTWRNQ